MNSRGAAPRSRRLSVLQCVVLLLPVYAAVPGPAADDDISRAEPAPDFETFSIYRPKVTWFGKRESRIDDFAVVTHRYRGATEHYFTRDADFSLKVVGQAADAIKLKAGIHTIYHPYEQDESGLLEDFVGFVIEEKTGIHDIKPGYSSYNSTYTATIVISNTRGDSWEFLTEVQWNTGDIFPGASGTLSNGLRTLRISSRPDEQSGYTTANIYENDMLRSSKIRGREYAFREDLDPEFKLLLLAGMEILTLNQRGEFW